MGSQIIVPAHAPVEIIMTHKVELGYGYAVLKTGNCFGVLNRMKGKIIQRKAAIRSIEVGLKVSVCRYVSP